MAARAREGHDSALGLILEAGAVECDARDENGWTLLRTAAWSGQNQCVGVLIQAGAQVRIETESFYYSILYLLYYTFTYFLGSNLFQ